MLALRRRRAAKETTARLLIFNRRNTENVLPIVAASAVSVHPVCLSVTYAHCAKAVQDRPMECMYRS